MKGIRVFLTGFLFLALYSARGQDVIRFRPHLDEEEYMIRTDSVSELYRYYFGELDELYGDEASMMYMESNPHYFRLFLPVAFYHSPSKEFFKMDLDTVILKDPWRERKDILTYYDPFEIAARKKKTSDQALFALYLERADLVVTTEERIRKLRGFQGNPMEKRPKRNVIDFFRVDLPDEPQFTEVEIIIRNPNFWIRNGEFSIQMSQNYISDNWYNGGESNNAFTSYLKLTANYNDKKKVQFDNMLEMKLGFNTSPSDTVHKFLVNYDLFRITSKLGIQAASHWYYTLSGEFNTQLFNSYKANDQTLVSAIFAPANLLLAIGIDYKLKNDKIDLSVILSPGAYNVRYVGNSKVNETNFGLKEGRKFLHDIGSKFQTTLTWKIIPSIKYETRIYYFTNYEKIETEWENTFDFELNKYLSTKLFVHTRFYDDIARKEGQSRIEVKELLSFGISYKW
ncbi:MAG: DUF3078 domain-containing protein [Bacteroides sp.]|nr:DUF3078 domain-containing protein [Bacteroides sp.]